MTWVQFWAMGAFIYEAGNKPAKMLFCVACAVIDLVYNWMTT